MEYRFIILILIIIILDIYFKNKKENFSTSIYNNNITGTSNIPKIVITTHINKDKIPKKVYENIQKYAPNYNLIIFDDNEIIDFLKKNYPDSVLKAFLSLDRRPHKADLFRYCYLYKYGGVYLDIKTVLTKNIDDIFNKRDVQLYTVISSTNYTIHQGIIATVPKNPIFLKLINYIVNIDKPIRRYFEFTIDFYNQLKKMYNVDKLENGYLRGNGYNTYLFNEKCTGDKNDCKDGLDRYNLCCYIYDGEKIIFKTRYSDYPWN